MDFKKSFNDASDSFSDEVKKGFTIAIVAILLLTAGNILGSLTNIKFTKTDETGQTEIISEAVQQSEQDTTAQAEAAVTATNAATTATTAPAPAPSTDDSAASTDVSAPSQPAATPTGAPATPAEIIAYFNESANKIKTDATKVVKNFEKRTHNEDKLVIHSSIQGLANNLMEENFKDDTDPIEYATKQDIIANYQVPGETWVSQLTEAEVAQATCNDLGAEYEITLTLNTTQNPENGVGVSKGVDTITSSEIMEKAPPMVKGFDTEYYNCVIKCKIDKATGRTTWSSYTTPVVLRLKLDIPIVGDFDAQVGMTFEKDYSITY